MLGKKKGAAHPILLVEDNMEDVFLMQRAFGKAEVSFPLMAVASKQQALNYLQGQGDYQNGDLFLKPALVLLDLNLPDGNGFEILEWIRKSEHFAGLPVIVLTSCCETPEIAKAYRLGANSYLVKPASSRHLEKLISSLCDYWIKLNKWA